MLRAVVLLALSAAAVAAQVSSLPPDDRRYALLIGVSDYDDSSFASFKDKAPENDVQRLRKALIERAGFSAENVYVLSSDSTEATRKPSRPNIIRILSRLESEVPSDGLFLFFFSGHGMSVQKRPFLLPSDAAHFPTAKKMAEVAVGLNVIRDSVQQMKVEQVILLVDACRNDPSALSKAEGPNVLTPEFRRGFDLSTLTRPIAAYATLFATSEGYRAYIDAKKNQGFFSEAVIEALGGAGATGPVTLGSVLDYVQRSVPPRVKRALGEEAVQVPMRDVHGYLPEHLVLAGAPAGGGAAPALSTAAAWELVGSFGDAGNTWDVGKFEDGPATFEAGFTAQGNYRWVATFKESWSRWATPYGPFTDFYETVRFGARSKGGNVNAGLVFGSTADIQYEFRLVSQGWFGLARRRKAQVEWVFTSAPNRVSFEKPNRMAVLVKDRRMSFYINNGLVGTYRDDTFAGGKLGVLVGGDGADSTATVVFGGYELRRPPE